MASLVRIVSGLRCTVQSSVWRAAASVGGVRTMCASAGSDVRVSATTIVAAPMDEEDEHGSRFKILFVQRNMNSSFMPGAHVFPGGVVEPDDSSSEWRALAGLADDDEAAGKLLDPSRICALRETFEEAGVLLMAGHGTELAPQLPALRKQCNDDATNFRQMVATHLSGDGQAVAPFAAALGKMHSWINFVTPNFEPKRFDARFFVYTVGKESDIVFPESGVAEQDGAETISVAWMSPRAVLESVALGDLFLPPPQWYVMDQLADFDTIEQVEKAAAARDSREVEVYQPHLLSAHNTEGKPIEKAEFTPDVTMVMALPGDEEHPIAGDAGYRHRLTYEGRPGAFPRYSLNMNIRWKPVIHSERALGRRRNRPRKE